MEHTQADIIAVSAITPTQTTGALPEIKIHIPEQADPLRLIIQAGLQTMVQAAQYIQVHAEDNTTSIATITRLMFRNSPIQAHQEEAHLIGVTNNI